MTNSIMPHTDLDFKSIPATLRELPQWVLWRLVERDGKLTKVPFTAAGTPASVSDPNTWTDFETAMNAYQQGGFDGIGFVLTPETEIVCVDIDHARNGSGWKPEAQEIVRLINSYTEVSPSGEGLHIWALGRLPEGRRRRNGVEMYSEGRFITVTGDHLEGTPADLQERTAGLGELHRRIFGDDKPANVPTPTATEPLSLADEEIIQRAMTAQNGEKFRALWHGDISGYPSQSEADLALCRLLAFWCGNDPARIEQLFSQSALGQREKWQKRPDYRERTITEAIRGLHETYSGDLHPEPNKDKTARADTATFTPDETYQPNGGWRNRLKRISEIQSRDYPELEWLVDGVLPARGLIVLAGRPKSGKSWLALDLALSIAAGADCLGRLAGTRGTTIYLALEDTDARIKERSEIIGLSPDNALIATTWTPADQGGYEELQEMVRDLKPKLIIIDTLSSFKAGSKILKKPQFEIDYEQARKLKTIADENDCCVLLVHHTRKADADDIFDTVSGTLGLNAVADAIAVLQHARGSNSGKLHVTGRDVSDEQYQLLFEGGRWKIVQGEAQEAETTRDKVLRAVRQWGPIQPRELSRLLGGTISYDNVKQTLRRLASDGVISKDEAGNYFVHTNTHCVTTVTVSPCHRVTVSPVTVTR